MTTSIEDRVKKIIHANLPDVGLDDLKPESRIVEDLGGDSLDQIEIVMSLEDEFGIQIDDVAAEKVQTVQQAVDFITRETTVQA